jgi:hypothetical protein
MTDQHRDQLGRYAQQESAVRAALAAKAEKNAALVRLLHPSPSTSDMPEARDTQSLRKATFH